MTTGAFNVTVFHTQSLMEEIGTTCSATKVPAFLLLAVDDQVPPLNTTTLQVVK